jgi:hypothetical protein
MNTKTIIVIAIALLVIILVIFFVVKRNQAALPSAGSASSSSNPVGEATGTTPGKPCIPYTQGEYDRAVKNCRNKCQAQILIPIVGVGAYSKCMNKCKQSLPFVQECF